MRSRPEFSVVIPAYNAGAFLSEAIESALSQQRVTVEVIVVDDGSTDETPKVLRNHASRVHAIRQPNQGVASARNRGIAEAAAPWVAFLDADDTWERNKLEQQAEALASAAPARASATAFVSVDPQGRTLGVRGGSVRRGSLLEALLLDGNTIGTPSSVVVERSLLHQVGGFNTTLSQCADWEMWIRIATVSTFALVSRPLVRYRQHEANMSRQMALLERDSRAALEMALGDPRLPASLRARRREVLGHNDMVLAGSYFRAGQLGSFIRCAARAVAQSPREVGYLISFPLRWVRRRHG